MKVDLQRKTILENVLKIENEGYIRLLCTIQFYVRNKNVSVLY